MDHTLRDGPGDPFMCPPGAVSLIRIAPIARAPYGYARVSTDGQTLAAQDAALPGAGCAKVFSEKASGAKADRAELRKVVSRLTEGDVLIVTRLDRLAPSTGDLLNTLDEIAKRGAGLLIKAGTGEAAPGQRLKGFTCAGHQRRPFREVWAELAAEWAKLAQEQESEAKPR